MLLLLGGSTGAIREEIGAFISLSRVHLASITGLFLCVLILCEFMLLGMSWLGVLLSLLILSSHQPQPEKVAAIQAFFLHKTLIKAFPSLAPERCSQLSKSGDSSKTPLQPSVSDGLTGAARPTRSAQIPLLTPPFREPSDIFEMDPDVKEDASVSGVHSDLFVCACVCWSESSAHQHSRAKTRESHPQPFSFTRLTHPLFFTSTITFLGETGLNWPGLQRGNTR